MISLVRTENFSGKRISRKSMSQKSAAIKYAAERYSSDRARKSLFKKVKTAAWIKKYIPVQKEAKKSGKLEEKSFRTMKRAMRKWLLPKWKIMLAALLANIIVGASTGALPVFIQYSIDILFDPASGVPLIFISSAVFLIMATRATFTYLGNFLRGYLSQQINASVQYDVFNNLIYSDYENIRSMHTGQTMSALMNESQRVQAMLGASLLNFARHYITLMGIFMSMFIINWRLALFVIFVVPIVFFSMQVFGNRSKESLRNVLNKTGNWAAHILETIRGFRIIKAYGTEARELKRAQEKIGEVLRNSMRMQRSQMASGPSAELIVGFGMAALFFYVGYEGRAGNFSQGELVGFISAMLLIYQPLKAVAALQASIQQGIVGTQRIFNRLDKMPKIISASESPKLEIKDNNKNPDKNPRILFKNVRFVYPKGSIRALKGVNLSVKPGSMVALVGRSGGGKSTVFNLLQRFYDVKKGSVEIDGQNIRKVDLASLRRSMSLVLQEVFLFDDTIAANIAYAKEGATREEIMRAAKIADAHDFIMAFPKDYETRIGENGSMLSGGQRQRLSLARAALRDAPILLLDEPTSALDSESEYAIQEAMKNLLKERTVLVIAHRLSTIMHADKIYVLDDGKVVEKGTHEELLKKNGAYASLYKTQFARAAENGENLRNVN